MLVKRNAASSSSLLRSTLLVVFVSLLTAPECAAQRIGFERTVREQWTDFTWAPSWETHYVHQALFRAGDVDGDGYPDYGHLEFDVIFPNHGSRRRTSMSSIRSGRTHAPIYAMSREFVAGVGDVDADGHDDLMAFIGNGGLIVLSGADLRTLFPVPGLIMPTDSLFRSGLRMEGETLGDIDRDGFDDFLAWFTGTNFQGIQVVVCSGRTGTLRFSHAAQWATALGDLDLDGVRDYATVDWATQPPIADVKVRSGATGLVLHSLSFSGQDSRTSALGDVDSDGVPDFAVGSTAYSGRTGGLLWTVSPSSPWLDGRRLHGVGDQDNDGVDDVAIGPQILRGTNQSVISSLAPLVDPIASPLIISRYRFDITRLGDLDRDGREDLGAVWNGRAISDSWIGTVVVNMAPVFGRAVGWTFGPPCIGSTGAMPRIGWRGSLGYGQTFEVLMHTGRPSSVSALHFGVPARIPLSALSLLNCELLVQPYVVGALPTDSTGAARLVFGLTPAMLPLGAEIALQWIGFDPGANPLGIQMSDGLVIRAGN